MKKTMIFTAQAKGFLLLSAFIFLFTLILYLVDSQDFTRFFGKLNPILVMVFLILLGTVLINFLAERGFFQFSIKRSFLDILRSCWPTLLLAAAIIFIDWLNPFSEDTNVLFPKSILFYPVMAFVVEVIFHLLPLTLVTAGLMPVIKNIPPERIIWGAIIVIALLEPVFQTVLGFNPRDPLWFTIYVGLHIFIINLLQLSLFKKYDFVSMYSFRISYYLLWHILWGYLRLQFLF